MTDRFRRSGCRTSGSSVWIELSEDASTSVWENLGFGAAGKTTARNWRKRRVKSTPITPWGFRRATNRAPPLVQDGSPSNLHKTDTPNVMRRDQVAQ